ncbi:SUMF1/EgtB/PvdO family nonheme iron enzyme [Polyangium spumosum]|uniref:SUMF1/EgtB/PvdO family nonheme iron enzyme n=1 Tax=Polyangium spumosum TaxID=889282 RepID=A0A6N7PL28_9BACT|nr:SUMF1/EgtB/PvdO family nonheme iron enzyme [Polyangium spumosum]
MGTTTRSVMISVGVGLLAGGLALFARLVPASFRAAPRAGSAPAPKATEAPSSRAPDAREALEPATSPLSSLDDRFSEDPAARAACPPDMTLVDGEFCPELAYRCGRRSSELGHGCAAYVRGEPCQGELDRRRYCIDRHEWPNRVGEMPRVYVNWFEAKELCQSVGKRLCRRSEWTLACEGPKRLPYPWGFVRQPSPCNVDRASIPADANALVDERTREAEIARLWQADPIGSHPACISAFGAYDMSGNVDEWTDNLADDPETNQPSTLNGGYWGPVRNTCRLSTKTHGPKFAFYQAGFRCCADTVDGVPVPKPSPWIDRVKHEDG